MSKERRQNGSIEVGNFGRGKWGQAGFSIKASLDIFCSEEKGLGAKT